jgi:basic amino acid/polyamine antiporter, APA family
MKNQLTGRQELKREMGLFSATMVVIANMIGTGIFTSSGFIIAEVGSPIAFGLCWLIGGLFAICGALCYGELGVRFPKAGGEYIYLREAFGPCLGFLSGWLSLTVGFSAPIAAAAMGFATYLLPTAEQGIARLTACSIILCVTLLHYHSLKRGTQVQNSLTLIKVSIIVTLVAAAILKGSGDLSHFETNSLTGDLFSRSWAVALIFVSFAYSGWNAAGYLGGEIDRPERNLPRALIFGTVFVMVLYLALNSVFLYALAPAEMAGHTDIGAMAAAALFGPAAGRWLGLAIAAALLSVLSAMIMTGPRVYYAMARDGVFFCAFGRLSDLRQTPAASIFLQATIAMIMVLTATFNALLIYIGFTLSLSAMLTVGGMMLLRHRTPLPAGSYITPGYPFVPSLFILGNGWIIVYVLKSQPIASLFGLATIGLGVVVYAAFRFQSRRIDAEEQSVISNRHF